MNEASIEDIFPLSPMHEGFLFQSLFDPDTEAYFVQINFRLHGILNPDAFREAWDQLSQRHGALRSAFVHEGLSRPAQVVLKHRPPEIAFADLSHLSASDQGERLQQLQREDRRRGFDLARDVLMRVAIFQTGEQEHKILWSFHHILLDGWSLGVLQREFVQVYSALVEGNTAKLPPVFPYGDYLSWLSLRDADEARAYWRDHLAGYEQASGIPRLERPDKGVTYKLAELSYELDACTTSGLRSLAAQSNVTLNTLVQCAWALVLGSYNDATDVVFGMIVSGRPPELDGMERMLGLCINAVAIRIRLHPGQVFTELLQAVQREALESQSRHHLPLAEIQAQSLLGRELFDHLLTFENYPIEAVGLPSERPGGFTVESLGAHDRTHYPFTLIVTPAAKLHIRFSFNANVYSESQMRHTLQHFLAALRNVQIDPLQRTGSIGVLPESERFQLLHEFNDTQVVAACQQGPVNRFEAMVKLVPEKIALVCGNAKLTYLELNRQANHLAHYLRGTYGVEPDERIGLLLDRGANLPVAVWGILKSGAAYVPMDPSTPPLRIRHILRDSGCRLLVTESKFADLAASLTSAELVDIECIPEINPADPVPTGNPDNLAYVIYTSGSTGLPKGCQIELGNLTQYLNWADGFYFPNSAGGTFGLYSPVSFDLTVTSLFLPLLRGKSLYVFPPDMELLDLFQYTFSEGSPIDSVKLTPSHISLLRYLRVPRSNVNLAIVGGEALSIEQVRLLQSLNPEMAIYNEYGPTETTVGCVVKRMHANEERVLIGKPIANTQIYVTRQDHLVPIGVTGELLIGGGGVGRGYLGHSELNAKSFLTDPWRSGQRLYRTGDLGRWLPDGNLELLGRADHQVKIRGYRIELGEIEHRLVSHQSVREAVVTVRDGCELAAYLIASDTSPDFDELRAYLAAALPDYMIPANFVLLDAFPLTTNGKVDRKSLPDPALLADAGYVDLQPTDLVAPRNEDERQLLEIWRDVLELDRISVTDNFFRLGGHSLKAMQIASQIQKRMGIKVALRQVFQLPTITELAGVLRGADRKGFVPIKPAPPRAYYDLSHAQQRLWLEHQMNGAIAYNIPRAFVFEKVPDLSALNQAFCALIQRHEVLRTAFVLVDGEPKQQILPDLEFRVDEVDLQTSDQADQQARAYVDRLANTAFDLSRPPLLRAVLMRLADGRCVFAFNLHHIVGDGWSENILYRDLLAFYEAFLEGRRAALRPLRIQYKDFAFWSEQQGLEREEEYWLRKLDGAPERIRLPYDFIPVESREFQGGTEQAMLSADLTDAVRDFAAEQGMTVSNVLLALFQLFLFRWTSQEDICVGLSIANRNHPDIEPLVGFFVNMLPIRTKVSDEMEFEELLRLVESTCHEALEYQDYPFDLMIRNLNLRSFNRQSLVNVVYNYLKHDPGYVDGLDSRGDRISKTEALDGTAARAQAFEYTFATSKFDLTLFAFDDERNLFLTFEYDSSLFRPETIRRALVMLQEFTEMLMFATPRSASAEN